MNRGRIILTSKRIVIFQKKGWINQSYKQLVEIPLEEITEIYSEVRAITGCYMKFRIKGGDWGMVSFPSKGANLFMQGIYGHDKSQKAVTDRWVNAINIARKEKEKSDTEDPTEFSIFWIVPYESYTVEIDLDQDDSTDSDYDEFVEDTDLPEGAEFELNEGDPILDPIL